MDRTEIIDRIGYHPATPATAPLYDQLRRAAIEFGFQLTTWTPECREQSLAITALEEALMWASKAVARTTPVDTTSAAAVARVLPDDAQTPGS